MKTKNFIILSTLICSLVWVHGTLAETMGYKDSTNNAVTRCGVLGVEASGNYPAICARSDGGSDRVFLFCTIFGYKIIKLHKRVDNYVQTC
jgi:hypothetical protein